jgi:hypothetical protein
MTGVRGDTSGVVICEGIFLIVFANRGVTNIAVARVSVNKWWTAVGLRRADKRTTC